VLDENRGGIEADREVIEQMRAFGAPQEAIDAVVHRVEAAEQAADFEVWADCVDAFEFFRSLRGQWRHVSGMSTARTGIDYAAVQVAMTHHPIPRRRQRAMFKDLQIMETAVLIADHELAQKRAAEKGAA
jgi:hypothetical protein